VINQAVFLAASAAFFLASMAALVLLINHAIRDIPNTVARAGSMNNKIGSKKAQDTLFLTDFMQGIYKKTQTV
jgi:hypothetical protein